jgi:ABC transporter substrate binding protein
MRRREFITLLGGAVAAWPLAARAQQPAMPVVGFLGGRRPSWIPAPNGGLAPWASRSWLCRRAHHQHRVSLGRGPIRSASWSRRRAGRSQGRSHHHPGNARGIRGQARDPIVMAIVGNPVDTGIVSSLARPGGNITGSSFFYAELSAKRLEIMKELMPRLARAGVLLNPDNAAMPSIVRAMMQTAKVINVTLQSIDVRHPDELEPAFERARSQFDAVAVVEDGLFVANRRRIAELAIENRLPSVGFREYCEAGGLAAYGVDFPHIWRGAGAIVDKILKGRKPADLPIEQASRFEFILNLKTAKSLGFYVSPAMSARANQVIE